ncbi:MAG: alpha/beta hydrolase [Limnohabitans sp.]|nr:alpha/beta hydrolase [Limnohabitans sp.]
MKPLLLLIPGMLNDDRVWADVVELVKPFADTRVAQVLTQSSISEMAQDAWRLILDEPADRKIVIVGFSMGGYVACEMVAQPLRPAHGWALVDSSIQMDSPDASVGREKTITAMQSSFPKIAQSIAKYGTHPQSHGNEALMQSILQILLDVGGPTAIRQLQAIAQRQDHIDALKALRIPVHVICGVEDKTTPPALSQFSAQTLPHAELFWIDKAGHMTLQENPIAVSYALERLVNKVMNQP